MAMLTFCCMRSGITWGYQHEGTPLTCIYAQVLSSHPLTLESLHDISFMNLKKTKEMQSLHIMLLENLEIYCLYEPENISSSVMKIGGIYHWMHGRKGCGVYWGQQACDEVQLCRIAQQLFECTGKLISADSFKQWEGLIDLLGLQVGTAGGFKFLDKHRDFKRSLQQVQDGSSVDAAWRTMESLVQVKLLNWKAQPLLTVSETNLLLHKLQELSMAKLHPDFCQSNLPPHALSSVRLALATNLHAILEEY